ncbi:MAG: zinc-dependent peptidase [Reichenbachiella sp.]
MNIVTWLLLLIIIAISIYVIGDALFGIFKGIRLLLNHLFRDIINRHLIIKKIEPHYKNTLIDTFYYYHKLNYKNKRLFEKRVQKFIDNKKFIPAGGLLHVDHQMKALIAASAIQITFGHPGVYFKNFKDIYVYPDAYFSEGMQQFNAGEVHKAGLIMLSWKDFISGYASSDDGRNLALHEMAHAVRLENMIKNEEYFYFNWDDIKELNTYTVEETNKIKAGQESIFRPYAAIHYQEFFAVMIEVFFEQPQLLKEYHLNLFLVTTRLLKQNPLDPNQRIK